MASCSLRYDILGPVSLALCLLGCSSELSTDSQTASSADSARSADLPQAKVARPALCERTAVDAVRDVFCGNEPANIASLIDLQHRLDLNLSAEPAAGADKASGAETAYAAGGLSPIVLLGHSTALSGALVSPINPRLIMVHAEVFLAFNRGVQQVELIAVDRERARLNFYLISFTQRCNRAAQGCTFGDLFTPRLETGWQEVTIQDDEELKNTPADCRQCHQRGTAEPRLLMRELEAPWTHFFGLEGDSQPALPQREGTGSDLLQEYLQAKADEPYGGVPSTALRETSGITLENNVGSTQPVIFEGALIFSERWPWGPGGFPAEPQRSPTWDAAYEAFKRGEQLALPFYAPRVTDAAKQARLSAAYQRYMHGELEADSLPDLSDIFPDDPRTRAELGLQTEPGATPAQLLVQACGACHNDVLDQTISRARFNIAVGRLDRNALNTAIARLELPQMAAGAMPPAGARQLEPSQRRQLIEYLEQNVRSQADDELLEHAARYGMSREMLRRP